MGRASANISRKARADSWWSALPDAEQLRLYALSKSAQWPAVAEEARSLLGGRAPSRAAVYRFVACMRESEAARRLAEVAAAKAEAGRLAEESGADDVVAEAFKALASDLAMRLGDAEGASRYVAMAVKLSDRAAKRAELEIRRRSLEASEGQLRLAREKFEAAERRLDAAKGISENERLTPEQKLAKLDRLFGKK